MIWRRETDAAMIRESGIRKSGWLAGMACIALAASGVQAVAQQYTVTDLVL